MQSAKNSEQSQKTVRLGADSRINFTQIRQMAGEEEVKNYPLEKQVCTLEQAKELAGLLGDDAPESLWVWANPKEQYMELFKPMNQTPHICQWMHIRAATEQWNVYPAYTGDELGVLLPNKILDPELGWCELRSEWRYARNRYMLEYNKSPHGIIEDSEVEAKAALLIQGLKGGWIRKEEIHY